MGEQEDVLGLGQGLHTQGASTPATAALSFLLCEHHDPLHITGTKTKSFKGDPLTEGTETL